MTPSHRLWRVAAWEFRRYVKLKQQIVGLVILVLMLIGGAALSRMGGERSAIEIGVIGGEHLPSLGEEEGRFRFLPHPEEALPELLEGAGERRGTPILQVESMGIGTLHTRQDPGWRSELEGVLSAVVQRDRISATELDEFTLGLLLAPFHLAVEEAAPRAGRMERVAAWVALGLTLLGLFSGISYIFSSVTAEKQNRLSEQVISAIDAQTWIEGKILGLSAVSAVAVVNTVLGGVIFLGFGALAWGWELALPGRIESPGLLLVALLIIAAGFLFWFALLTAVAAIMDDPHTSNRTQFMFLPMLPLVAALMAVGDPDAAWVRALALLPPTSGAVMPIRMLVTEVGWWEVTASLLLLLAAARLMALVAGRIFRVGMLMYGKEPSWGEVRRWVTESGKAPRELV